MPSRSSSRDANRGRSSGQSPAGRRRDSNNSVESHNSRNSNRSPSPGPRKRNSSRNSDDNDRRRSDSISENRSQRRSRSRDNNNRNRSRRGDSDNDSRGRRRSPPGPSKGKGGGKRDPRRLYGSPQRDGCSLIVRGLDDTIETNDIYRAFEKIFRESKHDNDNDDPSTNNSEIIKDVYRPRDHYTRRLKNFCFVEFASSKAAGRAIRELDGEKIRGCVIQVQEAKNGRRCAKDMIDREYMQKGGNSNDYNLGGGSGSYFSSSSSKGYNCKGKDNYYGKGKGYGDRGGGYYYGGRGRDERGRNDSRGRRRRSDSKRR